MVWVWFRRVFIAVVVLVVLLIGGVTAALLLVDTQAVKNQIEARVEAATGRELRIEGPLEISILPWLGFEVGSARLANAPGFGGQPFVAIERAELRVRALPLLRREVVLGNVVLRGLRVNAARDAQGRTNWADLSGPPGPEGQAPSRPAPDAPPESQAPTGDAPAGPKPLELRIDGVEVRDARFSWDDAASGQRIVLRDFGMTMRAVRPGRPTPVLMSGQLVVDNRPPIMIDLTTRVSWDLSVPRASFDNLAITVTGQGAFLPPSAELWLKTDVHIDGAAETAALERLTFRVFNRATVRGGAQVRFGQQTPSFDGRLDIEPFSPAELARSLRIELPPRADPETLQRVAGALEFSGTTEGVSFEPIAARVDQTELSGHVRANWGQATPSVDFALAADELDLGRYLPEPPADEGGNGDGDTDQGAGAGAPTGGDPIASLPSEALQGVAGRGRLTVGRLRYREVLAEEVLAQANLTDGVLELGEASARVAGGGVRASGRLDAADAQRPAARLRADIDGVQSGPLLAAFLERAPVTGALDADVELATVGPTLDAWINALDGNFRAVFRDGALLGINIPQRLRVAAARLGGGEVEQAAEQRRTDFSALSISGRIEDGVARSQDLDLRTPLLRVGGKGWVDLGKRTLDYTATLLVTGTLEGQGGAAATKLSGAKIPLRLHGDLASPSIELAFAEAMQQRARQKLEQEGEQIKQEAREAEQRAREELKEEGDKAEQRAKEKIKQEAEKAGERIEKDVREKLEGLFE